MAFHHFLKLGTYVLMFTVVFAAPTNKITVYLIGDSTMANKETKTFPETGWGMPFRYFFDSTVVVDNRAKNGRSTRSFISENLWQPIAENLKEGDYVFIQFGHNDESKDKGERYSSPEDFKKNLTRFVLEAKAKKATAVLLSPVARRRFKGGQIQETHGEYSGLVAQVAAQQGIAFIDLDALSRNLLQRYGEENSKLLFLQLEPGEHPNYPEGKIDNTHFSELGARLVAQIVLGQMRRLNLELVNHLTKPVTKK